MSIYDKAPPTDLEILQSAKPFLLVKRIAERELGDPLGDAFWNVALEGRQDWTFDTIRQAEAEILSSGLSLKQWLSERGHG